MEKLQRRSPALIGLLTVVLTVTVLHLARDFLIPLALATLFAFLLNPLVTFLERKRLPRALAVGLVTVLAFSCLGLLGWMIGREFRSLLESLPEYKDTIRSRVAAVRSASEGGVMTKLQDLKETLETTPEDTAASGEDPATVPSPPTPPPAIDTSAKAVPASPSAHGETGLRTNQLVEYAGGFLGMTATVIVFVIFMLLRQQELRNRLMRLAGYRHLTTTTRAMDEAGARVSRYLLMQGMLNGLYGLLLAFGLSLIGLPYVVLWGVLAALFRFIPYVGPVIACVLPSLLSLAVFDNWTQPLLVISLILGLELLTNMFLEPMLYGQSVGVSDFALLVAITFWTWLWGPIGLMIATPLTVVVVVICKYIPRLQFVDVLMGDKPQILPYMVFFQRLLAQDEEDARQFIHQQQKENSDLAVADETILPAIMLARHEAACGHLSEAEEARVYAAATAVLPVTSEPVQEPDVEAASPPLVIVMGRSLQEGADDAVLDILTRLLPASLGFYASPSSRLTSEFVEDLQRLQPRVVLLSATPPVRPGLLRAQIKRLLQACPDIKIHVGLWQGLTSSPPSAETPEADDLTTAGAAAVYFRLADAVRALSALV